MKNHMRILLMLWLATGYARLWAAMPPAEQNALVKQYCAVCHTDAVMNGGLSLQHYDAAKRDPSLAAMILSKLNAGAMGAAGRGVPSQAAQEAWVASTKEQAVGAKEWFVSREDGVVSASIAREVAPRRPDVTDSPVYRVKIDCNTSLGVGEMRLTWSPQPQTGRTMTASADGNTPIAYRVEGKESMGNGATVQTGHASIILSDGGNLRFPKHSLIVRELFPEETIEFPFSDLDPKTLAELSGCFSDR